MTRCVSCAVALILLVASSEVRSLGQAGAADEALVKRARAIHERVIALDTHDDINPENFTRQKNYTQRLETQVNLPKMVEGGLDASFFIVYVGQGPLTQEGYDGAYQQAFAGWNGAEETFNVTLELVRRGYTEEQIGGIWSGNLLRVMADVEKVAQQIQAGQK